MTTIYIYIYILYILYIYTIHTILYIYIYIYIHIYSPAISSVPDFMQSAARDSEAEGFKGRFFLDY